MLIIIGFGQAWGQTNVAPMLVNTDKVGQVGDEQAALTVRGSMVIGAYGLDPDLDGFYDENGDGQFDDTRQHMIDIYNGEGSGEILLWVERGVVGNVIFADITEWGDYVFDENYTLRSLDELKQYIDDNHHLPGVLSEAAIKSKGYSAHQMNKTMMVKIEELTLYTLDQQLQIEKLQARIESRLAQHNSVMRRIAAMNQKLGIPVSKSPIPNVAVGDGKNSQQSSVDMTGIGQDEVVEEWQQSIGPDHTANAGRVGANTSHVEEGTVFNVRGKTLIVPEGTEELPDLSWYIIDETDPEQECWDFSLFIDGYFVAGDVVTRDLVVEWSDYVFDPNYQLRSLDQVKSFIEINGHLPGIPAAEEIFEKGYAEFDMKGRLLEKIEELFLYQIEQQMKIDELKSTLSGLDEYRQKGFQVELNDLKARISSNDD